MGCQKCRRFVYLDQHCFKLFVMIFVSKSSCENDVCYDFWTNFNFNGEQIREYPFSKHLRVATLWLFCFHSPDIHLPPPKKQQKKTRQRILPFILTPPPATYSAHMLCCCEVLQKVLSAVGEDQDQT